MKSTKKHFNILPLSPEVMFLVLGSIFGIILIYVNPPFHANDEDRHFYSAYNISELNIIQEKQGDKIGGYLPKNLIEVNTSYQGIPFYQGVKISRARMKASFDIPLNSNNKVFHHNFHYNQNPIPYIPHAIGIAIGKIIYSNPVYLDWFARLSGLICYLLIVFFAIKITPVFKSIFLLYGLTPMVLYQGASVTYDMLSNSLSFLLVAIFLKFALEESSILGWKDLILIMIIALLHRFAKDGYILIPFLFFIIPSRKIGLPKKSLIMVLMGLFFIILYYLPDWTWGKLINHLHITGGAPLLKKDFIHNGAMNLQLNLANPVQFISNILANFSYFRQEWIGGCIGRFGYSYTIMPQWFLIIYGISLISIAFFDSCNDIRINIYQKLLFLAVGLGTILLIMAGMYMNSPVGAKMIFGLQGRYFVPAIPILLLLLYNNKYENQKWFRWKILIISLFIIFALTYSIVYFYNAVYTD